MTSGRKQSQTEWFSGRARLVEVKRFDDARGSLLPIEFNELPFLPRRLFTVAGVPAGTVRGGHAHRYGEQLLVCIQGCIDIWLRHDDEEARLTLVPDGPGLMAGPLVWSQQTYLRSGSVLLVVASHPYDPDSYIGLSDPQ